MRKVLLVLALVLLVPSFAIAIWVPQTHQEFVKAVGDGARMMRAETLEVDADLEAIHALLARKAPECLDVKVERSAYVGYWERSSSDYNPTLRRAGKGKVELSIQVVHRPRGVGAKPPPGGLYVMAADLRSLGKNRTQVALYYPSMGYKPVVKALKQWVSGEDAACPKFK